MKKLILLIFIAMSLFATSSIYASKVKKTAVAKKTKKVTFKCKHCNGTGFGPNSKGEKGKGNLNCNICKGKGRI